jgi:hypothetical protein
MNRDLIIEMAKQSDLGFLFNENWLMHEEIERFARLVAERQREEDAKLVESITLEWPDQPEFAQVERTTIQDCAKIIRQRAATYD